MAKKKYNLKSFIISRLRSASLIYPTRQEVYERIKVGRGQYKCESCGSVKKREEIHIDHIEPVVSVELGFTTWDDYINRMFCDSEGLQGICKFCHEVKTETEKELRASNRKKRKQNEKD